MPENKNYNIIRAFTALSVAPHVVADITERLEPLRAQLSDMNIKWVPVANYHITLCFIGNVPLSDKDGILQAMAQASVGTEPFDIRIGNICLFPDLEKGGVLVADVLLDDVLERLQQRMNDKLLEAGYKIYQRPLYRPHLTLARLKKNKIPPELLEKSASLLVSRADAVHLYKSWKLDGAVRNDIVASHLLSTNH